VNSATLPTTTQCICTAPRKIILSTVFAGQNVGVKQVGDKIWLVSFMDYDLGFFDEETTRLEPTVNPFEAKVFVGSMDRRNTRVKNVCWSLPLQRLAWSGIQLPGYRIKLSLADAGEIHSFWIILAQ